MKLLISFLIRFYMAAALALPLQKADSEASQPESPSTISVLQSSISFQRPQPIPTNRVIQRFKPMPGQGNQLRKKSKAPLSIPQSSDSLETPTQSVPANTLIKRYKPTPISTNRVLKKFKPIPTKGRRMELQKRGMSAGAIVGIVLGSGALVCAVFFIGWALFHK